MAQLRIEIVNAKLAGLAFGAMINNNWRIQEEHLNTTALFAISEEILTIRPLKC